MSSKPQRREPPSGSTAVKDGETPLARFEALTRRLLKVSPEDIKEQQRRYEKARDTAKGE